MKSVFDEEMLARISETGVVAVLVVDRVDDAVPVAQALLKGGVDVIELTLRTPVAIDAIGEIRNNVPQTVVGIGTVLTKDQVRQAAEAGAAFGVAPGLNPGVIEEARRVGLSFAPGVMTPTEIERAVEYGCRFLKFFPAEPSGGMPFLKSLGAPYQHLDLTYMPLGGITAENMTSYLQDRMVSAIGGSWIAPRRLIKERDWPTITRSALEARKKVLLARGG